MGSNSLFGLALHRECNMCISLLEMKLFALKLNLIIHWAITSGSGTV